MFVGRQKELDFLENQRRRVVAGNPCISVIEGPAGIGKTALLSAFLQGAERRATLYAAAAESESTLRLGVLGQLVSGRRDRSEVNNPATAAMTDVIEAGSQLLRALDDLQSESPAILAVDDLHWADVLSVQAIDFALRRLRSDRVHAVFTVRTERTGVVPAALERLVTRHPAERTMLAGLSVAEVRELAGDFRHRSVAYSEARRLWENTQGHPLHLRAFLEEGGHDGLGGRFTPPQAPASLVAITVRRLHACPAEAQRLTQAAAVLGIESALDDAGRVAALDVLSDAVRNATGSGLLSERAVKGARVLYFGHPLMRAAIYHDIPAGMRRELHARAADLTLRQPELSLKHRLESFDEADPATITTAFALAENMARNGAHQASGEMLLGLCNVCSDPDARVTAQLRAAELLLAAGDNTGALTLTEHIKKGPPTARRELVLGRLALARGRQDEAEHLLRYAWAESVDEEPVVRGEIAELLSLIGLCDGNGRETVNWARVALSVAPDNGAAVDLLGLGMTISGDALGALRETALPPGSHDERTASGHLGRGAPRLWTGDFDGALADLGWAASRDRRDRPFLPWGLLGLVSLAEAEYRIGAWDDSLVHGELAASISDDTEDWTSGFTHAVAAHPLASRGLFDEALRHIEVASQAPTTMGRGAVQVWLTNARAILGAARQDWEAVLQAASPYFGPLRDDTIAAGWARWRPLSIEALARLGYSKEARAHLEEFSREVTAQKLVGLEFESARLHGLCNRLEGRAADGVRILESADRPLARSVSPFDRAMLLLERADSLLALGRKEEAVRHSRRASSLFLSLAALPYVARCDEVDRQCGPGDEQRSEHEIRLTPHETAVVHLLKRGLTNREIAAELFVSVKTIEYHLTNIYAKLGTRSRSQLLAQLASAS